MTRGTLEDSVSVVRGKEVWIESHCLISSKSMKGKRRR